MRGRFLIGRALSRLRCRGGARVIVCRFAWWEGHVGVVWVRVAGVLEEVFCRELGGTGIGCGLQSYCCNEVSLREIDCRLRPGDV